MTTAPHVFTRTEQEQVARAWANAAALSDLGFAIHPSDEMLGYLAASSPRTDAHHFEYLRSGHEAFLLAEYLLAQCGRDLHRVGKLLDFACGCGRITRFFARALGKSRVVASDIDPTGVAFVGATFGVETVLSASDPARVALPRECDAIFVGSLFSHLPRARFVAWLRQLGAALAGDGLLLFSTHGLGVRPAARARAGEDFTFVPQSETERLDTAEYGSTYVTPALVEQLAREAGLTIVGYVERNLWDLQDVFVARRGTGGPAQRWPDLPLLYGRIEQAWLPSPGHAWIGGGTRVVAAQTPLREVRLLLDGRDVGPVNLDRPEPLTARPGDAQVATQWYTEGDATALAPGLHTVCAVGVTASGARSVFGARGLWVD